MSYLSWKERLTIPVYDDEAQSTTGRVTVDEELCNGCGTCVMICPGKAIFLAGEGKEKKARLEDDFPQCMSCNDCAAICERGAISVSVTYAFPFYYKTLHRGSLEPPRRF